MAGLASLSDADIALIKGMAQLVPRPNYQEMLAYFTHPGRDINHRLIPLIAGGWIRSEIAPAPAGAVIAYMAAWARVLYPTTTAFHSPTPGIAKLSTRVALLELNWWPVGQGLFMSGSLRKTRGGDFTWIYDCGSSSGKAIRNAAIAEYGKTDAGARRIDLVTLSHFDADHINGIVDLIRGRTIGTLLLPYLPLWRRLMIALAEEVAEDSALFEFFVDPVAYLSSIDGAEIGEILFVPPSGSDDAAEPTSEAVDPDGGTGGLDVDYGKPPPDAADEPQSALNRGVSIAYLRSGGRIVVPELWEFVPYNDAEMQRHATPRFMRRAAFVASALIRMPARRAKALALLKKIYVRSFGKGSLPQNLITLFLYSGPVGSRLALAHYTASARVRWNIALDNFAQLLTGDGYIETPSRLIALQRFYRADRRLERAGVLQVMHHGARGNSHDGVAAALAPAVSIFSSDPKHRYQHPDAAVLRDFWPWCPVQVDTTDGFHLLITIERR